jgi:hypothetical protein
MSSMLGVRDERRARSKSPGGRDTGRERSRSRDTREPDREEYTSRRSSKYVERDEVEDDRGRYKETRTSKKYYEEDEDEFDRRRTKTSSRKYQDESDEEDKYRTYKSGRDTRDRRDSPSDDDRGYRRSTKDRTSDSDSDRRKDKRSSRKKHDDDASESDSDARRRRRDKDANGYGHSSGYPDARPNAARHGSYVSNDPRYGGPGAYTGDGRPSAERMHSYSGASSGSQYANPDKFKYADPRDIAARSDYDRSRPSEYERSRKEGRDRDDDRRPGKYDSRDSQKYNDDKYETREPKSKKYYDDDDDKYSKRDKKYHDDKYGSSPEQVSRKMSTLAVGSAALGAGMLGVARHDSHSGGGKPPASPLLEAYKGTYQSISPMPSALVLANHKDDSDLSDLELAMDDDSDDPNADLKRKIRKLEREKEKYAKGHKEVKETITIEKTEEIRSSRRPSNLDMNLNVEVREPGSIKRDRSPSILSSGGPRTGRKSVSFYDPTDDAKKIAAALSGTRSTPDPRPLIHILPRLSTDDLIALKAEYKNHAKVSGQGINMAKHIKMRITGNLGKACYATALGRWESEAYWANSWYQGGASRRELLIESLMGRSNSDIREIKNCFKDKKYGDDLEKCIKTYVQPIPIFRPSPLSSY